MQLQPLFWGGNGPAQVQRAPLLDDGAEGDLGIACEPNCVFQICNQVLILDFRRHDMIYGGTLPRKSPKVRPYRVGFHGTTDCVARVERRSAMKKVDGSINELFSA